MGCRTCPSIREGHVTLQCLSTFSPQLWDSSPSVHHQISVASAWRTKKSHELSPNILGEAGWQPLPWGQIQPETSFFTAHVLRMILTFFKVFFKS